MKDYLNKRTNDTVINSDVISAPKAGKNTLGILKGSTFLTALQGLEGLGATKPPNTCLTRP